MKGADITDKVIETIEEGSFRFIRLNYPNGDMVGHTGDLEAAVIAAETVDLCLGRLLEVVEKSGGLAIITADHGNLDEMYEVNAKTGEFDRDKKTGELKSKTAHTLNPVPFIIFDPQFNGEYELRGDLDSAGLGNVAATILNLLDYDAPSDYLPSLIKLKKQ